MIIATFSIINFEGADVNILYPKFIVTPEEVLENVAVAFSKKIEAIDTLENLRKRYPDANVEHFSSHALLPGFANPHLHLEFSANRATLSYGDFIIWLESVIRHREKLITRCDETCFLQTIDHIIRSGTTAIGAISSYGEDLQALSDSPLKVQYFTEIIGSNPATADVAYADFMERFYRAKGKESERFKAGVAIHSPYSVHHILAQKALQTAKREDALVSVHFMESLAEREWLDSARGDFLRFFQKYLNQSHPFNDPIEFLKLFKDLKTLYVHMVWANEKEMEVIENGRSIIIHCPISNRLLGNGVLDLGKIGSIPYTLATDGLSSNYSLNMYEEMRAALFLHPEPNAVAFAKELIVRACRASGDVLDFNAGAIGIGLDADMQLVKIPKDLETKEEIYLHILLHTHQPHITFIQGERNA